MNNEANFIDQDQSTQKLFNYLLRYLTFWPWYLISFTLFFVLGYTYVRYSDSNYTSFAKIEIIDKAQDSEMALPTAMTVFNRSMIGTNEKLCDKIY